MWPKYCKTYAILLAFLIPALSRETRAQAVKKQHFNLDFEQTENGKPVGWSTVGSLTYFINLDSTIVHSGKRSALIEYRGGAENFKQWQFILPQNYPGKRITLSGYIKTENVTGYAGLWMQIAPNVAFENMYKNGIKGTTDWTRYEITLDMKPEITKSISFGGMLVGKGKMWLDGLKVSIDGKDIEQLKPLPAKADPVNDKEFDNGSKISLQHLDKAQVENLRILGLIWGFLKYYHPAVAMGNYNWDYELFRILPQVLNSKNTKERDKKLAIWMKGLGELREGKELKVKQEDVKQLPDLNWISASGFSPELTQLLTEVKNAERTEENYYVGLMQNKNPEFKHELSYPSMLYPDTGFRILALYRYWNIIQYYFPYKGLIGEDWKNVLEEFLPKFVKASDETEYTLTTLELMGRIHDTHANIWEGGLSRVQYFGVNYAPLELSPVENKVVVTGFNHKYYKNLTGLLPGDVITKVNGNAVEKMIEERLKYFPASNYITQLRDLLPSLVETNDSTIEIEFIRNGLYDSKDLKTYPKRVINLYSRENYRDTCFKVLKDNIAYIHNGVLKQKALPSIWNDLKKTKGLILDLRNYPSDYLIYSLSKYLLPHPTPFVKFSNGSLETPGLFYFNKQLSVGENNNDYYKGKVVILLNELSVSSAEFHAMAYRVHPNATVIGSTTAGADGDVSKFFLPGGINTGISGLGVYYPDGKDTQRTGIVPDIEVKPTIAGIKEGRDELMEKAIEVINAFRK